MQRLPVIPPAIKPIAPAPSAPAGLSSNAKLALAVGGLVAAALAAWFFFTTSSKSKAPVEEEEDTVEEAAPVKPSLHSTSVAVTAGGAGAADVSSEDEETGDATSSSVPVSKKDLLNLLDEMYAKVSELQAHLKALHEGGEITPEEIVEAHGEGIANIEKSLHQKYGVTQADLAVTYEKYDGDEEINAALAKLQSLFTLGDGDMEAPENLTADEFLTKFELQNKMMMAAIKNIVDEVKASGKRGTDAMSYFQQLIMSRLADLEKESQEAIGLTQSEFMGAFMKFGSDPRVQQAAMAVQQFTQNKQMELMSL